LLQIYCIQDLCLRSEQQRRGHLLGTSDHWGIFKVIQSGKSSSQVGLW
jgi:hypothetical protein